MNDKGAGCGIVKGAHLSEEHEEEGLTFVLGFIVGGREGESELCINSWFCVLLTHFFLLPVVYIHTERIVGWRGSLLVCGGSVI